MVGQSLNSLIPYLMLLSSRTFIHLKFTQSTCSLSTERVIYCINIFKGNDMILTTTEFLPNKEIDEVLGIARGSTVRARNIGRDIFAGLKNIIGGEIEEYTKLQALSREQALERMINDAKKLFRRLPLHVSHLLLPYSIKKILIQHINNIKV